MYIKYCKIILMFVQNLSKVKSFLLDKLCIQTRDFSNQQFESSISLCLLSVWNYISIVTEV